MSGENADTRGTLLLLGAALLYSLIYVVFWPGIYSTLDEASYLGNAYVLRQGTIYSDVADLWVPTNILLDGHYFSKYPLGMPALLALFSFAGWKFALGANLFVHLATFAVTAQILRHLRLPVVFALLYLLHPTAIVYSRTVMSDPASGLMIALAFWATIKRQYLWAGLAVGLALVFRTGNIIAVPVFPLVALLERLPDDPEGRQGFILRFRRAFLTGVGMLPGLAMYAYYSMIVAKGQLGTYTGSFGAQYFKDMFPAFALSLMLIFPGMLLGPILYRGAGKWAITALCYGCVLLYSFWYYRDQGSSFTESLVVGQRYMLAVMPLFIVAYGSMVWGFAKRFQERKALGIGVVAAATVVLFAGAFLIHQRHAKFLGTMLTVRDALLAVTAPEDRLLLNMQVAKLMHPGWGVRKFSVTSHRPIETQKVLIHDFMEKGTGRGVFAYWLRPGRVDDAEEVGRIRSVSQAFTLTPCTTPLPPELVVQYVQPRTTAGAQNE